MSYRGLNVALVIPCYNEGLSIAQVVREFRCAMPGIDVFVFDNNSTDDTTAIARAHGAQVMRVTLQGKGNVVRRMFADVEADIYVMVDGDGTYHALSVTALIDKLVDERLDMVVGCRATPRDIAREAYRRGHQWGNRLLTQAVVQIFGGHFTDMLSGYRVFTRRYAKSFPALSKGFEIETELTVHALELRMPIGEITTPYGARVEGSASKLSTFRDGWRILRTIVKLYVTERPLAFFGIVALLLALLSVGITVPLLVTYLETGLVARIPTAILSAAIMVCALLSLFSGLILDNVARGRQELKRLSYLSVPVKSASEEIHESVSMQPVAKAAAL